MNTLTLSKYHATGNDFLVRLALRDEPDLTAAEVRWLCDRHIGVGADGLITIGVPYAGSNSDCSFRLQNADGGDAEMSGNGMRALAALAAGAGKLGSATKLTVDTPTGIREVALRRDGAGRVTSATVDMGAPIVDVAQIPVSVVDPLDLRATVHGIEYVGDAIGMGNPHWVIFVDDVVSARVAQHGRTLETDHRFPKATNVEFARVIDRAHMEMRVWERGVGETLSCGTGACAAAAAARRRGLVDERITMTVPGGTLAIEIDHTVRLGGPVQHVFDVAINRETIGG